MAALDQAGSRARRVPAGSDDSAVNWALYDLEKERDAVARQLRRAAGCDVSACLQAAARLRGELRVIDASIDAERAGQAANGNAGDPDA